MQYTFFLRRSRQVLELWELFLLLLLWGGTSLINIYGLFSSPYLPPIFFFGVGSIEINQDLLLLDQISLRGGIYHSLNRFLFEAGSLSFIYIYTNIMAFVRVKSLKKKRTFDRLFYITICCQCRRSLNKVCSCCNCTGNAITKSHL